MKLACVLAVAVLAAPASQSQERGDWTFGIAIGTGERAGFFVRYYPVADVGAEAHALFVPIFDLASAGAGVGVVAHPLRDYRFSTYLGGHVLSSQYAGGGASRRGFSLGAGYEAFRSEDFADRFMVRASVSLARRRAFGTEARLAGAEEGVWSSWRLRPGGQVGIGRVAGIGVAEPDVEP